MDAAIEALLLLALPASGKSEVRRYLDHLDPQVLLQDLHLADPIQLDDYPYVHMMRRTSQELRVMGADPIFFADDASSFREPRDWGTLIHLVNEDFGALGRPAVRPDDSGRWLLDRFDRARALAGAPAPFAELEAGARRQLETAIGVEAAALADDLPVAARDGRTVVIEFARGGPEVAGLPLPAPLGYRHSLSLLSPEILSVAAVLYVWVTPEESRRRNRERTQPGRDGDASILHHGVPEQVMTADYGTDDMDWLLADSDRPGTVHVEAADGEVFHLPVARFDNRVDATSFLRGDPGEWPEDLVAGLHSRFRQAMAGLCGPA